jgi:hypothetical protein
LTRRCSSRARKAFYPRLRPRTILFCLSGHGHFDLSAYDAYLSGKLEDYEYPTEEVRCSIKSLPVTV